VLNAANEVAVAAFLQGEIGFLRIAGVVEDTLDGVRGGAADSLDALMSADAQARRHAEHLIARHRVVAIAHQPDASLP
jgi:1-deoxy-D-xylulose-5-phosphate reductoisomerase